jgi:hypothetical protein
VIKSNFFLQLLIYYFYFIDLTYKTDIGIEFILSERSSFYLESAKSENPLLKYRISGNFCFAFIHQITLKHIKIFITKQFFVRRKKQLNEK